MSGLVEKVKQRVRSVPVHRRASSQGSGDENYVHVNSHDVAVPPIPLAYENNVYSAGRTSLENSAFHVTTTSGRPITKTGPPIDRDRYQESVAVTNGSIELQDARPAADIRSIIPDRVSSLTPAQKTFHRHTGAVIAQVEGGHDEHLQGNQVLSPDHTEQISVAKRSTSRGHSAPDDAVAAADAMSHSPQSDVQPLPFAVTAATQPSNFRSTDGSEATASSRSVTRKPLPTRAKPCAPAFSSGDISSPKAIETPSVDAEHATQPKPMDVVHPSASNSVRPSEHVTLPEGFVVQNAEQTHVTEQVRPAVTQERIINERKVIVHKEITRDIHVHHYYTYVQPIKVVEILPPRHFIIDETTGEKIEIEQPAGWVMPDSMRPLHQDYSMVKGWTRHYLVDEEHPYGITEPASGPVFEPDEATAT